MLISKSKYINYKQCPKKLWLSIYRPDLADEMDQTVFINGNKVGTLAQGLFPGGVLIEYNSSDRKNIQNMVNRTKQLLDSDTNIIYEAAFLKDDYLVISDILVKTEDGIDIYEVKSSTGLKDIYIHDAAFQYWVITSAGYKVNNIYVTYINNEYFREGELDLEQLFISSNVTKLLLKENKLIPIEIHRIKYILEHDSAPVIDIGLHCNDPYTCQFKNHCYKHIPEYSVFDIKNMIARRKFDLYYQNIISFIDVRNNHIDIPEKQQLQVDTQVDDLVIIDKKAIKNFLSNLYYPLHFLDFETFSSPIPLFDKSRPYQQIPSQYSLHFINEENGELFHKEFLAKEGKDPRYTLAKRLIEDIPQNACVLAFNMSFEKRVIRELANLFDDLSKELMIIHDNIQDLMIPFRNKDYYIKEMKGSYSIKYILPALFPNNEELSYDNLNGISDGQAAANAYLSLTDLDIDERQKTREELLEYCKLDTLAMVKIWGKLFKSR